MNQDYLETQNDLGYGQLLGKLWRRRLWFSGVFLGVIAVSLPSALSQPSVYRSYMEILVESNYQAKDVNSSSSNRYLEKEFADTTIEVDYATHLKVLQSTEILSRVVDKLRLENSVGNKPPTIQDLKSFLTVAQLEQESGKSKGGTETKIIQTVYIGSSPGETKKVLEAVREVYLEYNLEQQKERLSNGLTFINDQIPKARQDLTEAEAALTQLSQEHNLIDPEQEAIALKANIRQITQEREALKAEQSQTVGNYTSIQEQLQLSSNNSLALSRLSQSLRYQNLLNKLQELEISLAEQRAKFTDDNPIIVNLLEEKKTQRALLIGEAEKILGPVSQSLREELTSLPEQKELVGSDTSFVDRITEAQSDLEGIRQRDRALAQTKAELKQQLTNFPSLISEYRNLRQEAEIKRQALQRLLEARQELEIELNRGGFNWQILEPPKPGGKIGTNVRQEVLLSLVVASFLGLTAAFIRETVDDRITNPQEIERHVSLPILGIAPGLTEHSPILARLPFVSNPTQNISTREVIEWQPFREALDLIYENFRLASLNTSLKSLAITSAIAGEGKSTFVLGLALTMARHQQRVLVIDADLRCPNLHKSFNSDNDSGLANYLAGEVDHPTIKQVSVQGETVDLITSGHKSADPVKLLGSAKFKYFLEKEQENYDLILVDTPPVIGMVDAIKVASLCDSTVLMMRLDKVKASELLEAAALLNKLAVLGIVGNDSKKVSRLYESQPRLLTQQV
ncbi:MAG: polysaccharide biosynthesis tyrosine autokinase [Cyanobacteria bacterium J06621_8]